MKINNYEIKRAESIKFVDVVLDENSTWKPHIKYIGTKISKSIELLFKANPFLNKKSLFYSYINYASVAWRSTYDILKKLSSQQKNAIRIISNKGNMFEHTKQLFQSNKILNVYRLNILTLS